MCLRTAYTGVRMHPTQRYVEGLKAIAHARVDQLGLGELVAEQRHKNVNRFTLAPGGHMRCPECLAHDVKSSLEAGTPADSKLTCPLCGFTVDRPGAAAPIG